jgi:hypothetical protein
VGNGADTRSFRFQSESRRPSMATSRSIDQCLAA